MTDALTDILDSIRLRGTIFSRAALDAPWGVESGVTSHGVFHAVVAGEAVARLEDGGKTVRLGPGDMVLMPFGDNHLMTDRVGTTTRPIGELTHVDERGMGQLVVDGGGSHTSLICGTIEFDAAGVHPVLSLLPRLVSVHDSDGRAARLMERIIDLIADEVDDPLPGSETVIARLTEVLVVYALRSHIDALPDGHGGWLSGLKDPVVAAALGSIHRQPQVAWTTAALAATVGTSRSSLHERFRTAVGETPAEYLKRWRVHLAMRMLRDENISVGAAARRVGYGTEAAFSNAFVRVVGVRPGAWKRDAA